MRCNRLAPLIVAVPLALLGPQLARALPVSTKYSDTASCDSHGPQLHGHELGNGATTKPAGPFPAGETIHVSSLPGVAICVPDDGLANDWQVKIVNFSGTAWQNLFFVADPGIAVGNSDGTVEDLSVPGVFGDAFRIDPFGANANLIHEDVPDGIFAPGETWVFIVTNFGGKTTGAPVIDSLGVAGASAGGPPSNASIIAVQAAGEPLALLLLVMGIAGVRVAGVRASG